MHAIAICTPNYGLWISPFSNKNYKYPLLRVIIVKLWVSVIQMIYILRKYDRSYRLLIHEPGHSNTYKNFMCTQ